MDLCDQISFCGSSLCYLKSYLSNELNYVEYPLVSDKGKCLIESWETPVMLDAPVSGGVPAAENGTLTFMV